MNITTIEGADLRYLLEMFGVSADVAPGIYRVRVSQSEAGVKVKVNEGMWSPALGEAQE